ncbi:3-deoxy-8-phosphooctulonate synthase, partial [bacterium]|nr:3-deoxy-8-phosphooctulonate synthase [bacterium]
MGGGAPLALIAGLNVLESSRDAIEFALALQALAERRAIPLVFKASWDKANRTSHASYRGPGLDEGIEILRDVKRATDLPLLTDVHEPHQAKPLAAVVDCLQIPAFLCRQTDLLVAAGRSGLAVNVKKGQFMAPWDIGHSIEKVRSTGNTNVCVTDRGVSFGYNALVSDMRAIPEMQKFGVPVVFDATHSVQKPSAAGGKTGGDRSMA